MNSNRNYFQDSFFSEECWKKEEEAVEKVYAQVAQLREQLQQAHADIDAKDYEISVIVSRPF